MQVGLVVGAIRINKVLGHLSPDCRKPGNVFEEFLASIPLSIPLGNARLQWAPEALMEMDKKIAPIEAAYRERLLRECIAISRTIVNVTNV